MKLVVDASVAVKWLVPEDGTEDAVRVLASGASLLVPDLLFIEAASALWKRVRRGQMTEATADTVLRGLDAMPLAVHGTRGLVATALALSCSLSVTPYDAVYLALAESQDCTVITADSRLVRALRGTRFAGRVRRLGD
jgi:predicted nucleic acid-binding protein